MYELGQQEWLSSMWCSNNAQSVWRTQSSRRKFPPHCYTTTTNSLNCWYKAEGLILSNSDPTIQMLQKKMDTHQTRQQFSILLLSNFGEPMQIVTSVSRSYLAVLALHEVLWCISSSTSRCQLLVKVTVTKTKVSVKEGSLWYGPFRDSDMKILW